MIEHTRNATLIAKKNDDSILNGNWDLYRCDITGLFFKFGFNRAASSTNTEPPHREYMKKGAVRFYLNHTTDIVPG